MRSLVPPHELRSFLCAIGITPGRPTEVRCAYCEIFGVVHWHLNRDGSPSSVIHISALTVDHVMPLALGGSHTAGNLALACRSCNSRKGAKHPFVKVA